MTREHAKKILTHLRNGKSDLMLMDALDMAISALSEDVRIHARWEDGHCSNCHVFIPDDLKTILRDYCDNDFCPNCGADMRGE